MPLIDSLATTDALAEVFSDGSVLQAMLDVELALARAAARAGAIPQTAADAIASAARADAFDAAQIGRAARESGTLAIPLVDALRERVRAIDPAGADAVHWSATSQDVTDTAMILLLQRARTLVLRDQERVAAALRRLSDDHAGTIMLGRTLLQPAVPITFGLKAARWLAAIGGAWTRVQDAWEESRVLQYGGAAGTRAAADGRGTAVAAALARELGLRDVAPWHTDRGRLGALVCACGLYVPALAKAARDVMLLMQPEIAEVADPGGGSSTMPHKQNPSGSTVVLAAALRMPALVNAFLASMVHEHERAAGGLQAEWPLIRDAIQTTGAAAAWFATVVEGLRVDGSRMRANVEATRGVIFAEQAVLRLSSAFGLTRARELVRNAVRRSRESGETFGHELCSLPEIAGRAAGLDLTGIERPEEYLGEAEAIRRALLRTNQRS